RQRSPARTRLDRELELDLRPALALARQLRAALAPLGVIVHARFLVDLRRPLQVDRAAAAVVVQLGQAEALEPVVALAHRLERLAGALVIAVVHRRLGLLDAA